jgi:hypothetical protein
MLGIKKLSMTHKIHLNLTRWLIVFLPFLSLTAISIYEKEIIPAACGLIATIWIFLYARPPSLSLLEDDIEFSLYGIKIRIPYNAISVSIVDDTRKFGAGVSNITRYSGVYPLKWVYWLILFGGFSIFVAITSKEGYDFKIARASVVFVIVGFVFVILMQTIKNKILSIRIKNIALNIFINKSHLKTLNKWPFTYYKTRCLIYQLDLISFINKSDLIYMINTFKEKLNEDRLHESVLRFEKEIS